MILWQWVDRPGHEASRLSGTSLEGASVFAHQGAPVSLAYSIVCDSSWRTLSANVRGFIGPRPVDVSIIAGDPWLLNGEEQRQVAGCIDIDLNFSPVTNLLPIRRLGLPVGEEAAVRAAWLRFPSMLLEPLEQTYRRLSPDLYRYTSAGGAFTADLRVNEEGWVVDYPGVWTAV
ncbi:MAG TPA: putative glycolipid-binding domain-containing protein [Thermoanaerobaculia bacterium]|jgi:hypothetical protein|nr:putative glycolipid-binding domain-containing protein [Thermoanaerobaculia bacterium]